MTELRQRVRPAVGSPAGALVLLHGRGADEHDLEPLLDELDPERRLVGVLPRAPLSLPPGGAHWYVVREIGFPDAATFWPTFALASRLLDDLPAALGVPADRVVIGGFSQGAVMAYALGLARGRPRPAAILALSGFMPQVDGLDLDLVASAGLPVAIRHGVLDPVIGVEHGRAARDRLAAAGAAVDYREARLPHTIDPAWLPDLRQLVAEVTGAE